MPTASLTKQLVPALQVDFLVTAAFDDLTSMGKVGQTSMRPPAQEDAVRELLVGGKDLKQAAEVILGRLDIADLVGGPNVQYKAAAVRLLSPRGDICVYRKEAVASIAEKSCP